MPDGSSFIIDEIIGKHEHIKYAIGINVDSAVRKIEIMEYTKSHGYEVRNETWHKEFVGKTANMPIKLHKDIDTISGATLSCKHLSDGVKRVMVMNDLVLKSYK